MMENRCLEAAGLTDTFQLITLGCKVNQYESAAIAQSLSGAGWLPAPPGSHPHVVAVNTCIVTSTAARQSRQVIRKAIRENPEALVAAIGCYAQVFPEELEAIDGLNLIVNNRAKKDFSDLLLKSPHKIEKTALLPSFEDTPPFDYMPVCRFPGRTRAYLKIQDGCRSFCSYCIVPHARGPCRSLPAKSVLKALEEFARAGCSEVVLTGIHLGQYGIDLEPKSDLKTLLQRVGKQNFPLRIRLSSLEPNELQPEIIEMAATEKWLCPHFHIPLQSGDNRILKKMNRRYSTEAFAAKIEAIRTAIPFAGIGVDIMTGFPGEDTSAHENTLALLKDLPLTYLHVFPFSPRKGTPAWRFSPRVAPETVKKRASELRALSQKKRLHFYQVCLKNNFEVLVEGPFAGDPTLLRGTAENYLPFLVAQKDRIPGSMSKVQAGSICKNRILEAVSG